MLSYFMKNGFDYINVRLENPTISKSSQNLEN